MSKDYRKRTTSRAKSRRSNSKRTKWVFFGVLLGLVLLVVFYSEHHQTIHTTVATHTTHKAPASTAPEKPIASAPEFDFYTVLPNMQVTPNKPTNPASTPIQPTAPTSPSLTTADTNPAQLAPLSPATTEQSTPTSSKPTTIEPANFLLQMASLKNYAEADRMKAQLTMQGFDVHLLSFSMNGQTFNRVVMGPYASKQSALQQQAQLQKSHIASILIKAP